MIRTYSILATSDELFQSPYVSDLKHQYDVALNIYEPKVVNFLFQHPLQKFEMQFVHALHDETKLDVGDLYIEVFKNQTLISCLLTAKEIGSFSLSFFIPYQANRKLEAQKKAPFGTKLVAKTG